MYKTKHFLFLLFFISISFPQNVQDLQKIKEEFEKSQRQSSLNTPDQVVVDPIDGVPQEALLSPIPFDLENVVEDESPDFFGYDLFTRNDSVAFWDNLPAPSNYLLGPGDEIVISLWGETQMRKTYIINRDGKIYDDKVGLLNLTGKNINNVSKFLNDQFGRVYSTLKGRSPTTYMDISLGRMRSININFAGEVFRPGIAPVHPFSTLISALSQVGGIKTTGSLREIQIKRDGKTYANFDLYEYLLDGQLPGNIQLKDQDLIFVPIRLSTVSIGSAVMRPGIYEARRNETIRSILDYAGGPKESASSKLGIQRIANSKVQNFYLSIEESKNTKAENGDKIEVVEMFQSIKSVEIIGQVKSPGVYNFWPGMKIKDLFNLAGGYEDTTFLKSIYTPSAEIIRRNPNNPFETVLSVNLNELFIDEKANLSLQNLDRFVVHANPNYFEKENVLVLGEVKVPGSYPVLMDNEPLYSFIDRAGGFTLNAFPEAIEIFRDSLRVGWENTNIFISPGDSIIIKPKTGVVLVQGEVYNEGYIEFQKGKSLRYYIDSAGGISLNGNKDDVFVMYPNGVVRPKKMFSSPKIKDGSIITVNFKQPEEPFNPTEFANTTLTLLSSLVTIVVLSKQINP